MFDIMHKNHEGIGAVMEHRGVSERPLTVRPMTSAVVAGRSDRRQVSLEHPLRDQVRDLRLALSDLTIHVDDLAEALGRQRE